MARRHTTRHRLTPLGRGPNVLSMETATTTLTAAGHPIPLGWESMGSSERDLYDERMDRAAARTAARANRTSAR